MNKDKMNELFEKSQEIINMMKTLGIKEYHGYSITETAVGNFLLLNEIPITPHLIDIYINNDLNKFVPKTSFDILEKFNNDAENLFFKELEETYLRFIYKKS